MNPHRISNSNRHQAHINVHEMHELGTWARKLGVTPQDVRAAVDAVGSNGDAVAQHLKSWYKAKPERPESPRFSAPTPPWTLRVHGRCM